MKTLFSIAILAASLAGCAHARSTEAAAASSAPAATTPAVTTVPTSPSTDEWSSGEADVERFVQKTADTADRETQELGTGGSGQDDGANP